MKLKTACLAIALSLAANCVGAQEDRSENAFVVKPYLQIGRNPSASSLQLLWHASDLDTVWTVEYRDNSASPWRATETPKYSRIAVAGVVPRRVYNATLTGLVAGTIFSY